METLTGWGRYPAAQVHVTRPATRRRMQDALRARATDRDLIARGMGRSYGDSSLASQVLCTTQLDELIGFDATTGTLICEAGVTLDEIIRVFVQRGWFLPVTPGTRFVTIGGAIAADVHGKNHHLHGCFSEFVDAMDVLLADGSIVSCSRIQAPDLFHATCGGMGLTGIILSATLRLRTVRSGSIEQITWKARNLAQALQLFDVHAGATYTVAWIDCISRGAALGRSHIILGEHADAGPLYVPKSGALPVPMDAPDFVLNRYSIAAFNALYYSRLLSSPARARVPLEKYFYPLDGIAQWNRLYGAGGFVQYQFVVPQASGMAGIESLMRRIADSGMGSFLSVLKMFGAQNANLLSFPLAGYTLALDFKLGPGVLDFLEQLDARVLELGGRVYLTKDARLSRDAFRHGYPRWEEFQAVRARYGALGTFASLQSRRLELD